MSYTLWHRESGGNPAEIWSGEIYADAMKAVLDLAGDAGLSPQSAQFTAAAQATGKPVSVWSMTDENGDKSLLIISQEGGE
jgi:hypothetical protein